MNSVIRSDSRISANPVMTLVFGDPKHFLASLHPNSLLHCSAVWSCRQKVSLLSLTHIVEQNDGKDALPVLWRFLHRVNKPKINMLDLFKWKLKVTFCIILFKSVSETEIFTWLHLFNHAFLMLNLIVCILFSSRKQRSDWLSTYLTSSHSRRIWSRSFKIRLS